jgi:pimeloyl-ACP methyl ester carboxylesterase
MSRLPSLLAGLILTSLISAPLTAQEQAPPRTYVIVHGAWGGSWDWRTVDSLLTAQGHRVFRPDLTGLGKRNHLASAAIGLDTHIQDVVNEILWEELTDVVLVGHSYGGMVITGVADSIPGRIRALIYVDAFLPEAGESVMQLAGAQLAGVVRASTRDGLVVPAWEPADKGLPKDVPHPLKSLTDPIRLKGEYRKVPARYILTLEPDRVPDSFQAFADRASRRSIPVQTMQAGHTPERTHPGELVRLITTKR